MGFVKTPRTGTVVAQFVTCLERSVRLNGTEILKGEGLAMTKQMAGRCFGFGPGMASPQDVAARVDKLSFASMIISQNDR